MNLEELRERTKETIILHGPEAWKKKTYLENARQVGLALDQAVELANTLVEEVRKHNDRIKRFHAGVTEEYERRPLDRRDAPLDERLLQSWLVDLHPLKLSENFVRNYWIPALTAQLPSLTKVIPPVNVPKPTATPISSGVYLGGALFVLSLLALAYWPPTRTTSKSKPAKGKVSIENSTPNSEKEVSSKTPAKLIKVPNAKSPIQKKILPSPHTQKLIVKEGTKSEPVLKQSYDEIGEIRGQFGERQARKGDGWGLWSDRKNDWLIQPNYEDITVFGNGRATVHSNGNDYDIGQNGKPVRE